MSVFETPQLCTQTATEMAQQIRDQEVTSYELVEAHIAHIEAINPKLNALVVPLFDEARTAAQAADEEARSAKQNNRELGPLHGVPISIKEFFDVRGTRTTAGIESDKGPVEHDAPLVARLREAGAIILGKTNVPQLGIAIESENPVYGRTNNPRGLDRAAGGSSGGEAALIAAGGSPLGLASDGGGSIRIPSHFCGLCGIKPTANRLTMNGHWQFPAFPHSWSQPGPLARSVDDLELALNVMHAGEGEASDPSIAPSQLRSSAEVDLSQLTIGYYTSDDAFTPSPAIRRAVEESVEQLKNSGATLVEFEPAKAFEVWEIQLGQFAADGGKWMRQYLRGSKVDSRIQRTLTTARLPTAVRRALPSILKSIGQPTLAQILGRSRSRQLSAYDYQAILCKQQQFRASFLERLNQQKIDALVCPPFASVASKHNSPDIVFALGYTQTYNLLGMPCGVVPFTTVQSGEESDRSPTKDGAVKDLLKAEEDSVGMPVGVQVVARHWREDVALAVMRTLHG